MADGTLHGVNLTGWLSLEPWVTPELFAEAGALDEDALLKGLGARNYAEVVRRHRNSFITRDDFVRIASRGFNAVRLPVPWYAFGDGAAQTIGFVGCMEHVDDALDWAEELGLKVIFALAINPGGPGRGADCRRCPRCAAAPPARRKERRFFLPESRSSARPKFGRR